MKRLYVIMILTVLCWSLTGCTGKQANSDPASAISASEVTPVGSTAELEPEGVPSDTEDNAMEIEDEIDVEIDSGDAGVLN